MIARAVYFSIEETGSGSDDGCYYIGYYFYHPVDGGSQVGIGFAGHEHDMEGIFLIVRKAPYIPYGQPIMALTQAHGAMLPYFFPGRVDANVTQSLVDGVGAWAGQMESWYDPSFGINRTVTAIRTSTHGTYMAQDCNSANSSYFYDEFGAFIPNSLSTSTACIHSQENWILYVPGVTDNFAIDNTWDVHFRPVANVANVAGLWRTASGFAFGGVHIFQSL